MTCMFTQTQDVVTHWDQATGLMSIKSHQAYLAPAKVTMTCSSALNLEATWQGEASFKFIDEHKPDKKTLAESSSTS